MACKNGYIRKRKIGRNRPNEQAKWPVAQLAHSTKN